MHADLVQIAVQQRISAATGISIQQMEGPTVLHYAPGEQITNHYDFVNPRIPNYEAEIERRGFAGIFCPSLGDSLSLCEGIALTTEKTAKGFRAKAAIPLAALRFEPKSGQKLKMDLGYIYGNAQGGVRLGVNSPDPDSGMLRGNAVRSNAYGFALDPAHVGYTHNNVTGNVGASSGGVQIGPNVCEADLVCP